MARIVLVLALAGIVVAAQAGLSSMGFGDVGGNDVKANLFPYRGLSVEKEDIVRMYLQSDTGGRNTPGNPPASKWYFSSGEPFGGAELFIFRGGTDDSEDDKVIQEKGQDAFNVKMTEYNHFDPKKPHKPPKPPKNKSEESDFVGFNPEP
jgi:hypothetical protein